MIKHPDDHALDLFVAGRMNEHEEEQIESHLAECSECNRRLEQIELLHLNLDPFLAEVQLASKVFPVQEFIPNRMLNKQFRMEELLGRGGMGVVCKAFDITGNRSVVLKYILPEVGRFSDVMTRLRESFLKVHTLQHTNICPLYGIFEDPEHGPFLVMKYIDGITLSEYRKRSGTLPLQTVIKILTPVASGLDYAHSHKVIHRDVKPQNIMLSKVDGVQIIDFDLADVVTDSFSSRLRAAEKTIAGTRVYMAPEQWQGASCVQTDQYALAITAYELLAGHVPFMSRDIDVLSQAVRNASPAPIPGLPDYTNAALLRALAKDPKQRFSSCCEFVAALSDARFTTQVKVPGQPDSNKSLPTVKFPFLTRPIFRIALIAILGVLVFSLVSFVSRTIYNRVLQSRIPDDYFPAEPYSVNEKVKKFPPVPIPVSVNTMSDESPSNPALVNPPRISRSSRSSVFPTIRYFIDIDRLGIVSFSFKRGHSMDPFPEAYGVPFDFTALGGGLAFLGQTPDKNRVIFPFGIIGDSPNYPNTLVSPSPQAMNIPPIPFSFGWQCSTPGLTNNRDLLSHFSEGNGIFSPGVNLVKRQNLPLQLGYEVVDDPSFHPPDLKIMLNPADSQNTRSNDLVFIHLNSHREEDGTIVLTGSVVGPTVFINSETLQRTNFTKKLVKGGEASARLIISGNNVIPGGAPFNPNGYEVGYQINVHPNSLKPGITYGQFDLTYLELVGDFEGSIGIPRTYDLAAFDMAFINNILLNRIKHHPKAKIIGINGTDVPEKIMEIVNHLKFGDKVELNLATPNRLDTTTPENTATLKNTNVTLYAQ